MSWLNSSLNTLKGQLTNLAQEVLAETAGPGDEEYRGEEVTTKTALELLAETQTQKEQLDKSCEEKDREIAALRKQITKLQNQKISDSGGGDTTAKHCPKSSNDDGVLENSWCWEPDQVGAFGADRTNELVDIKLASDGDELAKLRARNAELEQLNSTLNSSLDELDAQHEQAMQDMLELKTQLQSQVNNLTHTVEELKQQQAQSFIAHELALGRLQKECTQAKAEQQSALNERDALKQRMDGYAEELSRSIAELADLQALLEKRNADNGELIERIRVADAATESATAQQAELEQRLQQALKGLEELKQAKEKKTSESSTSSSTGKQSEDEFIVVRDPDAASSSDPTTPPTKEKLRDKLVALEARIAELTLENGSLALKLQDRELEKQLSSNVLAETLQELEQKYAQQCTELSTAQAAQAEAQQALSQLQTQGDEQRDQAQKCVAELESRLLISESEKEQLQLELQTLRNDWERKLQQLSLQNQELKLNVEADQETQTVDMERQLAELRADNQKLRQELDASIAQAKFRQAIAEEKQEITDLDEADDAAAAAASAANYSLEKLQSLLQAFVQHELEETPQESLERAYRALSERWQRVSALEQRLAHTSEELVELQDHKLIAEHEKKTLEADISQYILQCDELMKNNELLLNELDKFKRNKLETIEEHHEETIVQLEAQLEETNRRCRQLQASEAAAETRLQQLESSERSKANEELKQACEQMQKLNTQLQQQLKEQQDEALGKLNQLQLQYDKQQEELTQLQTLVSSKEQLLAQQQHELSELQVKHSQQELEQEGHSQARLQSEAQASVELQNTIDSLSHEKLQMIEALQQKHAENTQYYAEIQRLQQLVATPAAPCSQCPKLEIQLAELSKEREKLQDQIIFLKEKSDILTTNLLTEQTNQRLLQQEKADMLEQHGTVQRDLERLRAHLLEIEELHTQESLELQQELEETRAKMLALQEQVSKSSNAYTSASIRANQQAETLQAQHGLLLQQRDELLFKLGQCEDRELKQQAALTNLQCALEQFQNDKQQDVKMATQRIRKELQMEQQKLKTLQSEMAALQQQLADANQGLRAAARLSDQLEAGQQTIAVLRDEVDALKEHNAQLEQNLSSSESSQTDKIDKSLIKSLLIGYVVSGHAGDKQQVLRMISSVLDFSAPEADKVGLNKPQSSWLGSILGGGTGAGTPAQATSSKDNLVQAFVQFLEQESQPQAQTQPRPTLLSMTPSETAVAAASASGSNSTSATDVSHAADERTRRSSSSSGGMLHVAATPMSSNEFAPTRNSSSILKDILSDS